MIESLQFALANICRRLCDSCDTTIYGQDEHWVRNNFEKLRKLDPDLDDADDILSRGYLNWVNDRVGYALTNGFYKFTALFENDPLEATQLYIGNYVVSVTNAGEYVFLLEKGTDYEFGTRPFNGNVDYWAQDDMGANAPLMTSVSDGLGHEGEWTVDGGERWLDYPEMYDWGCQSGYCCMMPTLQGSPTVTHLGPEDFPKTFDAVLSDITQDCEVEYEWITDTVCFDVANPNAKTTTITAKSLPRWDETSMSVTAKFKNKSLTSHIQKMTVGTNSVPMVSISLLFPSVIFLNDDNRGDRIYRLSAVLQSDSVTNGTFTISHSGDDDPLISTSTDFANTRNSFSYRFNLNENCLTFTNNFYVMSRDVRHGAFTFTCTLADGTVLEARRDYNVIEPLCKLVTTQKGPDGRYVNPSRLVWGTNAWLQVGVRGDFSPSQVQWSITSGTCRYLQSQDYMIKIEPTVMSGVAVVRARFNDDPHQPTFTLPITMPRTIPVKAFIVNGPDGCIVTSVDRVRKQISTANEIFDQVGIKFDLSFIGRVMSTNFYSLAKCDLNPNGTTNQALSAQVMELYNVYTNRDCIEVYYVSQITNSKAAAFSCAKGIVMSQKGSDYSLAHELGHALGALDCYAKTDESPEVSQWFKTVLLRRTNFGSMTRDWGDPDGRGFYEITERHASIVNKCLMNGFDGNGQADIPDGTILSLKKGAKSINDRWLAPIGATSFEGKTNEEVYSR